MAKLTVVLDQGEIVINSKGKAKQKSFQMETMEVIDDNESISFWFEQESNEAYLYSSIAKSEARVLLKTLEAMLETPIV